MPLKVVILNDTRGHHHFGCHRVMRFIEEQLASRDMEILARSLVRNDWEKDRCFLQATARADLILINGEGTLHHGSRHGEKLLRIATHPVRQNKPVAIVNALYQENPESWRKPLSRLTLVATRDSRSQAELAAAYSGERRNTLDFSVAEGFFPFSEPAPRESLVIGESVLGDVSKKLIALTRRARKCVFLPIMKTLKSSRPQFGPLSWWLREALILGHRELFRLRCPQAYFSRSEDDYALQVARAYLHITGRFHAVCFSLITRTPFLTFRSNSWKIEALLEDVGLRTERLIDADRAWERIEDEAAIREAAYTKTESERITAALTRNQVATAELFDRLHDLAAATSRGRRAS